jgi:gamma-glutamyltranspeptidase / glutathione hydrolase
MTDRWLNWVLGVVVVLGLTGVTIYEQPRRAEERAEFLGQEVARLEEPPPAPEWREPVELVPTRPPPAPGEEADEQQGDGRDEAAQEEEEAKLLDTHGVTASHPLAVDVGMEVLAAGGNAVDAAIAVAYALGVVEPFGSGVGGGGVTLIHRPGEEPLGYDYREIAPLSGQLPASRIGVPGFVAGMEAIHADHGTIDLAALIEPAARLAEDGVEVDQYLHDRLRAAGHRLPIHLAPRLFPNGTAIAPGALLQQPEYARALRHIQEQGAAVMYTGQLAEEITAAASGLEMADFAAYEVIEAPPAVGTFAGYDVVSGGAPVSGPTVVQLLQLAERRGLLGLDLSSADAHHIIAQAWRQALADRTDYITDPTMEGAPTEQERLLEPDYIAALADRIPIDGFAPVEQREASLGLEGDTTHFVVVDRDGTMVSVTNTLSNFFGSGLPVSGFFLNDQLKNFSWEPGSVNQVAPGKRPRSFIAPTIVVDDGRAVLGLGSPGGRRIPMMVAQVLIRWAGYGQDLETATAAPRFHLENRRLEVEQPLPGAVAQSLAARGYQVTTAVPTTEYFGGIQALLVEHGARTVRGVADARRAGAWAAAGPAEAGEAEG